MVFEVASGSTLNVYCADTEDTCEGATFIGSSGSVTCSGDGCSNALTDVPRGDDDGGGGGDNDGGGGGGGSSDAAHKTTAFAAAAAAAVFYVL